LQDEADSEESIAAQSAPKDPVTEPPVDESHMLEAIASIDSSEDAPEELSHIEQTELFEQRLNDFEVTEDDAVELFNSLRDATRLRLWQFDMALGNANSTSDPAIIDPAEIERQHPGFPKAMYQLPSDVKTIRDLYSDVQDLFWARNRVLDFLPPESRERATGTALRGVQELGSELDLVVLEIRHQVLRLPQAAAQIKRMAIQAPVPLIWIFVEFWLAIVVFRWWRGWVPRMLQRMRSSFLAIRPRTEEILTRLRGLWYVDQVRTPLEWLLFWGFIFHLLEFDGLELVREIGWIVVQWIMLSWFAVAILNAIAARGAGGLAGESAKLRLRSMRLIATWLVLLGLGLELSNNLVGDAALTAWVWRIFQLLAFPLAIRLLSIWHVELYRRLQREGQPEVPFEEYIAQRGVTRWVSSAKVAGYLFASQLSSSLMRRIDKFDPVRAAAGRLGSGGGDEEANESVQTRPGLPDAQRIELVKGYDEYSKYARLDRRAMVTRINDADSGIVGVIGERGIGKNGFIRQVAEAHEHNTIFISCRVGNYAALEAEFEHQLGLTGRKVSDEALNAAIVEQDVRFIAIYDVHMLVRPVMGGFSELAKLNSLFDRVKAPCIWGISVDRYAWQLINRARSSYSTSDTLVRLRPWTDEQIGEFIEKSCAAIELEPDFSKLRVPRQYMDTAQEQIEERNRAGVYNMIASLSRGNPSIAIRMFADAIRLNPDGSAEVILPATRDDKVFDGLSLEMLLVLRVLAQSEVIAVDDVIANLRMDENLIRTTLHFAELRGWVEHIDRSEQGLRSGYRLTWTWFRTITRVLGRKNLLAGVAEVAS
jgi:hypothetical protein